MACVPFSGADAGELVDGLECDDVGCDVELDVACRVSKIDRQACSSLRFCDGELFGRLVRNAKGRKESSNKASRWSFSTDDIAYRL